MPIIFISAIFKQYTNIYIRGLEKKMGDESRQAINTGKICMNVNTMGKIPR